MGRVARSPAEPGNKPVITGIRPYARYHQPRFELTQPATSAGLKGELRRAPEQSPCVDQSIHFFGTVTMIITVYHNYGVR